MATNITMIKLKTLLLRIKDTQNIAPKLKKERKK